MTRRHCLALDLRADPELIARYEEHHRAVWPEVVAHLRRHGVVEMEIFRIGTRLVMLMETDDTFDPFRMAAAEQDDPRIQEWEALMWRFQCPTPWTPPGKKWTPMDLIFRLTDA